MNNSRRQFSKHALQLGIGFSILGGSIVSCKPTIDPELASKTAESLRILLLGGTSFLGPHQIAYAISRGHQVTTFTRGKTKPTIHRDIFDQVEMLIGDRKDNLSALEKGEWDVVIDNSGHDVEWARSSAELLKDRVGMYVFTSSTGVYYPYLGNDIDENTELLKIEPEGLADDDERKLEYWYGVMKTNSEMAVQEIFGKERTLVVRPTYMIGPGDRSDRFIYWPIRLPKGGDLLVPGKPEDPVQYIDVRDVAEWTIRQIEKKTSGTYNVVGPEKKQTMSIFAQIVTETFDVESKIIQIDDYDFLRKQGVLYLVPWIPPIENNYGSSRINSKKALDAGLTFRPLRKSIKDTHDWWYSDALTQERRDEYEQKKGSLLQRETEILDAWKKHKMG